ncbi:Inner membrane protein YjdF [Phycisphaerales bacterium]|nr:Inner membrane protein YjdF [Phycisphaerales bacterium]
MIDGRTPPDHRIAPELGPIAAVRPFRAALPPSLVQSCAQAEPSVNVRTHATMDGPVFTIVYLTAPRRKLNPIATDRGTLGINTRHKESGVTSHPAKPRPKGPDRLALGLLLFTGATLAWSGYHPKEAVTWVLEVSPAVAAMAVLWATYRRFPLTPLCYVLIALHALLLIVGGHYTYSEVPIGHWFREQFDLSRNHYDRLGHFVQGFVPAIAAREVLLRGTPLKRGGWLFFIIVSICVAIAAVYELLEWAVAVVEGGATTQSFLGTQGDVWDTQKDIALCLVGAVAALLLLPWLHDRQLRRFE